MPVKRPHVFKWKAIYRIIKNQRSPQIEEQGRAFSVEFAALLGSTGWCLIYLLKVNVAQAIRALTESTLRDMLFAMVKNVVAFLGVWGHLIPPNLLDALANQATIQSSAQTAAGGLTGVGQQVGGAPTGGRS